MCPGLLALVVEGGAAGTDAVAGKRGGISAPAVQLSSCPVARLGSSTANIGDQARRSCRQAGE